MISSRMTDPAIAISQVPRLKKSWMWPTCSALARKPPSRAPRMPIAVVPMQPGSVRPGITARAMVPAQSPRMIQAMIPIGETLYSQVWEGLALARAGVVAQVPEHVAGGTDADVD